jgi:hypothetical protein
LIPVRRKSATDRVARAQVRVEAVWSNLKRSLANLTKQNIDQLTALVKTWLRRMQYRPASSTASWPRLGSTCVTPTIEDR